MVAVAAWWTRIKRLDGNGPNKLGLNMLDTVEFGGVWGLVGSMQWSEGYGRDILQPIWKDKKLIEQQDWKGFQSSKLRKNFIHVGYQVKVVLSKTS